MEHSYRYRLRFGGPIWLPKLPSIFPRVFENFQATDRSISHARRYRFPKIATGNRTILVSLSMFYAGHRWYMCLIPTLFAISLVTEQGCSETVDRFVSFGSVPPADEPGTGYCTRSLSSPA